MTIPETMKAIVLKEDFKVSAEVVPTPRVTGPDEVVVRTLTSGLCGRAENEAIG
jgi:threonine dehydrogenase-like Zn-dependent dehydrogenase